MIMLTVTVLGAAAVAFCDMPGVNVTDTVTRRMPASTMPAHPAPAPQSVIRTFRE
jgi:hypothetical protein